jgi:DNA-binding HxlR family transcriptional regulator
MALGTGYDAQTCNLARALEIVGERWTMLVLRDCFYGVRRFTDLLARLDISRAVLTDRLAALVDAGLLERHSEGGHPSYVLTDAGVALWPSLFALSRWGERFAGSGRRSGRTFWHAVCETEIADSGRCPRCGIVPGPADLVTVPGTEPGEHQRTDRVSVALRQPHRLLTPIAAG